MKAAIDKNPTPRTKNMTEIAGKPSPVRAFPHGALADACTGTLLLTNKVSTIPRP